MELFFTYHYSDENKNMLKYIICYMYTSVPIVGLYKARNSNGRCTGKEGLNLLS